MIAEKSTLSPIERKLANPWIWLLFMSYILTIFAVTSPFMFYWPLQDALGEHFQGGIAAAEVQFEEGNMQRRIGMLVLLGTSLLALARTRNRFHINGLPGLMTLIYLMWILCSLSWSIAPMFTLRRLVVVYIIWVAATVLAAQISLRQLAGLALFVTGMSTLIGFGNEVYLGTFKLSQLGWRFSGVFHSVQMSWNCGIMIISTLFLLSEEKKPVYRVLLYLILFAGIFFLGVTKTRSTVVATLLAMIIWWTHQVSLPKRVMVISAAFVALGTIYMFIGSELFQHAETATTLGRGEGVKSTVWNLTGRVPLWQYSMRYFWEKPILGMGFSSFVNQGTIARIYREIGWAPSSIHSVYFNELVGTGIIGFMIFMSMFFLAIGRAYQLSRRISRYNYLVAVLAWASLIYVMEASLENGMTFMAFFVNVCYARLAFVQTEEWK